MGQCRDCLHFDRSYEVKKILSSNLYGCTYLNQYVKEDGSCSAFTPKPTYNSGSGCFLTSACVDFMGKADDCEELTALRNFRDNYIKNLENGNAIIAEYYEIAPKIVNKIDCSDKKKEYYDYIYNVIRQCMQSIEANDFEKTLKNYENMVLHFKEEFAI